MKQDLFTLLLYPNPPKPNIHQDIPMTDEEQAEYWGDLQSDYWIDLHKSERLQAF